MPTAGTMSLVTTSRLLSLPASGHAPSLPHADDAVISVGEPHADADVPRLPSSCEAAGRPAAPLKFLEFGFAPPLVRLGPVVPPAHRGGGVLGQPDHIAGVA